jgi:hypothetical protein
MAPLIRRGGTYPRHRRRACTRRYGREHRARVERVTSERDDVPFLAWLKLNDATAGCMCDGIGAPDRIKLVDQCTDVELGRVDRYVLRDTTPKAAVGAPSSAPTAKASAPTATDGDSSRTGGRSERSMRKSAMSVV